MHRVAWFSTRCVPLLLLLLTAATWPRTSTAGGGDPGGVRGVLPARSHREAGAGERGLAAVPA